MHCERRPRRAASRCKSGAAQAAARKPCPAALAHVIIDILDVLQRWFMRSGVLLAAALLAACATENLAITPPAGVDLSGRWQLDEADSDDPMRLMQAQLAISTANAGPSGPSGSGGQRGQQGGRGASPAAMGPIIPSVTVLDEALRWPGKSLVITQGGGSVTFASNGRSELCRPSLAAAPSKHNPSTQGAASRDLQTHGRGD